MKKLPIGIQTFSKLIKDNCLYVDKTKEIFELISSGEYFFLSRPRRFGKSLLVSTLEEIFRGNKELFAGLYIYDKIDWKTYPVIHIDFSTISHSDSDTLKKSLSSFLDDTGRDYDIKLSKEFLSDKFKELIIKIYRLKNSKVIILIDEYDKPITDYITDKDKALKNREVLREFYSIIKGCDEYIKFVFLTGVSKFSKVSIFSGLNNLKDITLDERYSTIVGITEKELKEYFKEHIKQLQKKQKSSKKKILEEIKLWYNGYSWDGKIKLYNPFSLLNLFDGSIFNNYWFTSGTTKFLIDFIKQNRIEIERYEGVKVGEEVFDSYDIDNLEINSLLFQTGYLTIQSIERKKRRSIYKLSYPNFEVKTSLLNHLIIEYLVREDKEISTVIDRLENALLKDDIDEFIKIIRSLFAGIPYTLHIPRESYYHSLFYMILTLLGLKLDLEVLTDKGRVDGVLELEDKLYVIEFKYGETGSDMKKLTDKAIEQIKERKYYEKFSDKGKDIIFLAIVFIDKEIGFSSGRL